MIAKKKLLVISSRFPYPLEKGDKLRLYHQIKVLSKEFNVSLVSITDNNPDDKDIKMLKLLCEEVYTYRLSMISRLWSMITGVLVGRPFQVSYFYSASVKQKIHQLVNKQNPEFIYCQLVRTAPYAIGLEPFKVIDYMDAFAWGVNKRSEGIVFHRRLFYQWEAKLLNKYEAYIKTKFDGYTIISDQDRERLAIHNNQDVVIVPNGVDTEYFTNNKPHNPRFELSFIGNMGYVPNVRAATYISEQLVPAMQQEGLDYHVLIAGARPTKAVLSMANEYIEVRGWVEDIRDAYMDSKIFIAPLFVGIGQQNKILEAMSMGIPCITTSMVNNSIGAIPGESILIADTVQEYIIHMQLLMNDKTVYTRIQHNAMKFVRTTYSWASQTESLTNVFK